MLLVGGFVASLVAAGCAERTGAIAERQPAASPSCARVAAPGGSDSGDGTVGRPFRTARRLVQSLRAGETGCLRKGRYAGAVKFARSGRRSAPIRLRSYPGERARLVGLVWIAKTADHVHITHMEIVGDGTENTVQVYGDDAKIAALDITNRRRGRSCLILGSNAGYGQAERPVVSRNFFHDCGSPANSYEDHAIYVENAADGLIIDNVIVNPAAFAIQFYPNAQRMRFAHNVVDVQRGIRGGVIFAGDRRHRSNDNVVERNVITHAATFGISGYWESGSGSGNVARHNCLWGAGEAEVGTTVGFTATDNVVADPLFVNRAKRDYRLSRSSPCLPVVGYDSAPLAHP